MANAPCADAKAHTLCLMIPANQKVRTRIACDSHGKTLMAQCSRICRTAHRARKAREKLSGTDKVGLVGDMGDVFSIGGSTCFGKTQTLALPSESMKVKCGFRNAGMTAVQESVPVDLCNRDEWMKGEKIFLMVLICKAWGRVKHTEAYVVLPRFLYRLPHLWNAPDHRVGT
jgi:hypothetical protein